MNPALELKTLLLGRGSVQGVVLEASNGTALVSTQSGTQRVAADVPVTKDDLVTVRSGRIVSKRTGGVGGSVKVYHV
jgi:hypothetical protein